MFANSRAAVTRVLDTAEWKARVGGDYAVDEDLPNAAGRPHMTRQVISRRNTEWSSLHDGGDLEGQKQACLNKLRKLGFKIILQPVA